MTVDRGRDTETSFDVSSAGTTMLSLLIVNGEVPTTVVSNTFPYANASRQWNTLAEKGLLDKRDATSVTQLWITDSGRQALRERIPQRNPNPNVTAAWYVERHSIRLAPDHAALLRFLSSRGPDDQPPTVSTLSKQLTISAKGNCDESYTRYLLTNLNAQGLIEAGHDDIQLNRRQLIDPDIDPSVKLRFDASLTEAIIWWCATFGDQLYTPRNECPADSCLLSNPCR